MNYAFRWSPNTLAANTTGALVRLKTRSHLLLSKPMCGISQSPPRLQSAAIFSHLLKIKIPLCLFLDVLHRRRRFQAHLRVYTPEPSKVSLSCFQHLSPSHAPCHPQSLVRLPVPCHWLYSSLPVPRLLKATCQFSWRTHTPFPLLLTPLPFNLNMTRMWSGSRQVTPE